MGLAALHLTDGRPERARQVLQQAQQVAPDVFQLFVDEIAVLAQQKQLDEAEATGSAKPWANRPTSPRVSAVARTMLSVGQRDAARNGPTPRCSRRMKSRSRRVNCCSVRSR